MKTYYADEFLAALQGKPIEPPPEEEEEKAVRILADDIEQESTDFVLKRLSAKLKRHGLAEFVGRLLSLMGYKTKVSPPGGTAVSTSSRTRTILG